MNQLKNWKWLPTAILALGLIAFGLQIVIALFCILNPEIEAFVSLYFLSGAILALFICGFAFIVKAAIKYIGHDSDEMIVYEPE